MNILVVSNYSKDLMKLERLLYKISLILPYKPKVKRFDQIRNIELRDYDAVILTGTDSKQGLPDVLPKYDDELSLVRRFKGPVLGICFGHQLIATFHGGKISLMKKPHLGFQDLEVINADPLFTGLSKMIKVYEAHGRAVLRIPKEFTVLVKAKDGTVEAIKHKDRPIYGLQFHPERYSEEFSDGKRILENFFKML